MQPVAAVKLNGKAYRGQLEVFVNSRGSLTVVNVVPLEDLVSELKRKDEVVHEAVAAKGVGVFDTLKSVAKLVLTELRKS